MNHKIFNNRTNSLSDYLIYLQKLLPMKFEHTTMGNDSMAEYNQLSIIMKDLVEIYNKDLDNSK